MKTLLDKKIMNLILIVLGITFLVIGIVGIFLPLLPTTPFLLLSAFLFSKGSKSFHDWLINHKYLGQPIKDWNKNKSISMPSKVLATSMLTLSGLILLNKQHIPNILKIIFLLFAIGVLTFIWTRKSQN